MPRRKQTTPCKVENVYTAIHNEDMQQENQVIREEDQSVDEATPIIKRCKQFSLKPMFKNRAFPAAAKQSPTQDLEKVEPEQNLYRKPVKVFWKGDGTPYIIVQNTFFQSAVSETTKSLSLDLNKITLTLVEVKCFSDFKVADALQKHLRTVASKRLKDALLQNRLISQSNEFFVKFDRSNFTDELPFQAENNLEANYDLTNTDQNESFFAKQKDDKGRFTADSDQESSFKLTTGKRKATGGGQSRLRSPKVCPHCNKSFPWASSFRRHLFIHSGVKPYSCKFCDVKFASKSNMQRHIYRQHSDSIIDDLAPWLQTDQSKKQNGDGSDTSGNLNSVSADDNTQKKTSPSLLLASESRASAVKHDSFVLKSPEQKEIQSTTVAANKNDNVFVKKEKKALLSRNLEKKLKPDFMCGFCKKNFPTVEVLKDHLEIHKIPHPWKCSLCGVPFTCKFNCRRHILRRHGEATAFPEAVRYSNE